MKHPHSGPLHMSNTFLSVIVLIVGIYLLFGATLFVNQSRFIYFPDRTITATPELLGLQYKDVTFSASDGIDFPHADDPIRIMFVLVGSKDERNYHLRALMAIAQIAQEKHFEQRWLAARDTEAIRNLILLSTRKRDTAQ